MYFFLNHNFTLFFHQTRRETAHASQREWKSEYMTGFEVGL